MGPGEARVPCLAVLVHRRLHSGTGADPSRATGSFAATTGTLSGCADSAPSARPFTASGAGNAGGFEHGRPDTGRHEPRSS